MSINLTRVTDTVRLIEFLADQGGFFSGSKAAMAKAMDWTTRDGFPDRRRVEECCNLTRDQKQFPALVEIFTGCTIVYSMTKGGLWLEDPTAPDPGPLYRMFLLQGDLQAQQREETVHRRRQQDWEAVIEGAYRTNDLALGRLCDEALKELKEQGRISNRVTGQLLKLFAIRLDGAA